MDYQHSNLPHALQEEKYSSYKQTGETWELKTNRLTSGSSAGT